jgi:hypothetical protein
MATTPTVPSAPVSAPAPTSSPAPATSTSTPSTPSVHTSTPAAQPVTPAAVPTEQKSFEQRLSDNILKGFNKPADTANPVDAQAAEAAAHVTETPAGESTEQPAAETQTPEQTAAETQPASDEDPFEWEAPKTATPKELLDKLNAKPELKAALEADPELRDLIFSNARVAAKTKGFSELFGSVDEARAVSEGHKSFANLRNLMGQVKPGDLQSTQPFINAMLEQGALRDDEGNLLRRQDGSLVTDGSVGRLFNNMVQLRLSQIENQAKQSGDNETLAALDTIMERAGYRTPSSVDEDEMSDGLKAQKAQLDAQQKQMDEQRATQQKEAQTNHDNTTFGKIDLSLDKAVGSILDRATGLTPFTRKTAEHSLRVGLKKSIAANPAYQAELDVIERMPLGDKRAARHVALATRYVQDHLLTVARPIFAEAGITIQKQADADKQTSAARAEAARSEVRGSSAPAKPTAPQNAAQQNAQIRAQLTQQLGRDPSLEELLAARMRAGLAAQRTA